MRPSFRENRTGEAKEMYFCYYGLKFLVEVVFQCDDHRVV